MNSSFYNWKKYYKLNFYYHYWIEKTVLELIPRNASVIEFGSRGGELLSRLPNKVKLGVEFDSNYSPAKKSGKSEVISFVKFSKNKRITKYDYVLISHAFSTISDVQSFIKSLDRISKVDTKVIVFYFNYFWKPFLDLAEKIGLKLPNEGVPNWLSQHDIDNFFYIEDFEKVKSGGKFIAPYRIPFISEFINRFIAQLPFLNDLTLIRYSVYKVPTTVRDYSVSVIIPARNESGHMKGVIKKIPKFGKKQELIFVEGHSKDDTYEVIKGEIDKNKKVKAFLYKQKGKGKGDAVRLGFSKAKNELLMILDADLTVDPIELPKFYEAVKKGKGELVMGSRLIYPMEKQAMRTLNILGNKFFSWAFSFLLDQKVKDTLCGTKVLLRDNYKKIEKNRSLFGDFDPFGDYDLIFGSAKLNLKIIEIPIRYKERTYGTTNISRFRHGFLLLQMVFFAAKKLKFV